MHVAILDSEKDNIKYLSAYIRSRYSHWIVNAYTSAFALVTAVYDEFKGDVELLILHVEEEGSIEMERDLQQCFPHIRVIFYSGTKDFIEKIFLAAPIFFLNIPFCEEMLAKAFERVQTGYEEDFGRTITIQSRGRKQKLRFSAIRYMESFKRKLFLYTDNGSFETYMTMEKMLQELPPQFLQCHRSYIINSDRIEKYSIDGVLLTGGIFVPVSRSYQRKIKELLNRNL